jgi:RimJ/RimL family protein N-acetyltransferase
VSFARTRTSLHNSLRVMMITQKLSYVVGHNLCLRLIQPEDAEFVFGLRTNPAYNEHLSSVTGSVEDQRQWIETYKSREAKLRELYYVIERKDGLQCGVVRLYDIKQESFTWGSWILDHNKPFKAALESAILVYTVAFQTLGLSKAEFEVRNDNANTLSFHRRFSAVETHNNESDTFFILTNTQFFADLPRYQALIKRDSK